MQNNAPWNGLKKIAGIILIIFGILGLFLPFLQGIAMIVAGVYLLGDKELIKKLQKLQKYFSSK